MILGPLFDHKSFQMQYSNYSRSSSALINSPFDLKLGSYRQKFRILNYFGLFTPLKKTKRVISK